MNEEKVRLIESGSGKSRRLGESPVNELSGSSGWAGLICEIHNDLMNSWANVSFGLDTLLMPVDTELEITFKLTTDDSLTTLKIGLDQYAFIPAHLQLDYLQVSMPGQIMVLALEKYLMACTAVEFGSSSDPVLTPQIPGSDPIIVNCCLQLLDQISKKSFAYTKSLISTLSFHLVYHYSGTDNTETVCETGLAAESLKKAIRFIHENYSSDLTTESIARQVNLNSAYFARMFKKSAGVSPRQYIISCRVNKARALLSNKSLNISQVAHSTGFYDQSHFTNCFKKIIGITPSQYVKNISGHIDLPDDFPQEQLQDNE